MIYTRPTPNQEVVGPVRKNQLANAQASAVTRLPDDYFDYDNEPMPAYTWMMDRAYQGLED